MQPLFEHRLALAGHETRVLELEGDAPAILLFHGYADSADTWRPLLAELGKRDRRAIAVDLPGFGAASRLREGEPMLPQYDALGRALARYAGEGEPVIAAGNSLGGVVSLRLAALRPELPVAGVVPIAPAGLDMPRWFTLIDRDPVIRTLLRIPIPVPEAAVRAVVGRVYGYLAFARAGDVPGEVFDAFTSHHRDRAVIAGYLATGRRLLPELDGAFAFDRVTCPVRVVWGTKDRMVTHKGAERIVEALPGTEVRLLDGVGHCPQLEAPAAVLDALTDFPPTGISQAQSDVRFST